MNLYKVDKGAVPGAQPRELRKLGGKELKIGWSDGHASLYSFRWLRQNCQCALCVDEWSGKPILAREKVPADLEGLKVGVVGQYALGMQFSDGHSTGLYTFGHLRKICPCAECEARRAAPEPADKKFLEKEDLRSREQG